MYPEHLSGGSYWKAGNCDDEMCQIDDKDDFGIRASIKFDSALASVDLNKVRINFEVHVIHILWCSFNKNGLNCLF